MFLVEIQDSFRHLGLILMVMRLSSVIDPPLSGDYEYLQRCWEKLIDPHPGLRRDWLAIGKLIYSNSNISELDYDDSRSSEAIRAELARLDDSLYRSENIYRKLCEFRDNYIEYLNDSEIELLDKFISLSSSCIQANKAFHFFHKANHSLNAVRKLKAIRNGMDLYSKSLPVNFKHRLELVYRGCITQSDYQHSLDSLKSFLCFLFDLVNRIVDESLRSKSVHHKELEVLRKNIEDLVMSSLWQISQISLGKSRLGYLLDKKGDMPIALDEGLAEGKALQRIRESIDDSDWILVSQPDEVIDVDELDEQLRACGYIE